MLTIQECLKARSEITAFKILQDGSVAFSTRVHGAKIFSSQTCSVLKNLSIELLGHKTTAVTFSGEYELLAFANSNLIHIVSTKTKTLLQTIRTSEGIINLISFIPNSFYLIAGTQNGRVMQYRYDGRSQLSRLCSFGYNLPKTKERLKNNYVSAFTSNNDYMAFSGYGGIITILKIHSHASRRNIEISKSRINALCFIDDNRLISGNVDGLVQIHSLKKYQAYKNIETPFINIQEIITMPNPRFVMVSSKAKNLIIIDTKIAKVISLNYLNFEDNVSRILLNNENDLLVVLNNNKFLKVELPTSEHIKFYISNNEIDKAYKLIDKDPMLKDSREHKRVEFMYDKLYMQAIDALIRSNTKEARTLMKMFSDIPSKKIEVNAIFKAFEYFERFKTLCMQRKYALAYAMAEKHSSLKHTMQYKKMEEQFKEDFSFAQKQILIGRKDIAKDILLPYSTVLSKKPIIKLFLNQNNDFIDFLQAISAKDFNKIESLIKKNSLFSKIPTFTSLKNSNQQSLDNIQNFINKGDISSAIEHIKLIQNIPSLKDELKELYTDCKLVKKLQKFYEINDFNSCYEIIDNNFTLNTLDLTQLLEAHWAKVMDKCETFALKGDIKNIKTTLGSLIHIKSRVNKIGDLIRLSFHIKIKSLMAKKSFKNAENIIYSYMDIFGIDSEISLIMRTFDKVSGKKLAISLDQNNRVPRDNWLNSPIIMQ